METYIALEYEEHPGSHEYCRNICQFQIEWSNQHIFSRLPDAAESILIKGNHGRNCCYFSYAVFILDRNDANKMMDLSWTIRYITCSWQSYGHSNIFVWNLPHMVPLPRNYRRIFHSTGIDIIFRENIFRVPLHWKVVIMSRCACYVFAKYN